MTDNPKTCADPYLDSFAQSFAAANYTAGTIRTYRHLARKLGRLMDAAKIEPSALTPDLADQLAQTEARGSASILAVWVDSRDTRIMPSIVPIPRGAVTKPAVMTG